MIRRFAQAFVIVIGLLIVIAEVERLDARRDEASAEYLEQLQEGWK